MSESGGIRGYVCRKGGRVVIEADYGDGRRTEVSRMLPPMAERLALRLLQQSALVRDEVAMPDRAAAEALATDDREPAEVAA